MKLLGILVIAVCVAISQQRAAQSKIYLVDTPQHRQIIMPRSVKLESSQIGMVDNMKGENVNQVNIGNLRGVNLGGKVAGEYSLDDPEKFDLFGLPIEFDTKGSGGVDATIHIGRY